MRSSILKVLRYVVFGLFISCNAIVASIAVWNHSLADNTGIWEPRIDIYLIFLGCLGLAHIFTIIFIELAYRHSIAGQVWFECLWFGAFWLMYLAGASAATALLPDNLCENPDSSDTCSSSRLLLAFTWFTTGILLFYFLLLVTASLLQFPHDSEIFQRYVHKFPWADLQRSVIKPPPPSIPQVFKKMPSIIAPKPQRPPPVALYNHRAGLSSEYEIESYATPEPTEAPLPAFTPPPALLSMMHKPLDPYDETFQPPPPPPQSYATPSFYPHQVQAVITSRPEPKVLQPVRHTSMTRKQLRLTQGHSSEPAPLGSWPRRSILATPQGSLREKSRRKPPPETPEPTIPASDIRPLPVLPPTPSPLPSAPPPAAASSATPQAAARMSHVSSSPPRARPSGPRRRSAGEARVNVPELSSGRNADSYQSDR